MLISVDMEANGSKVEPMLGWPPILAYPLKGKQELIRVRILGPLQFTTKFQRTRKTNEKSDRCVFCCFRSASLRLRELGKTLSNRKRCLGKVYDAY